jgi:hypothetical protein
MELGFMYLINSSLSLQIDANFLRSENMFASSSAPTFSEPFARSSTQASFFSIAPLFRINVGTERLRPYFAIGPMLGTPVINLSSTYTVAYYNARRTAVISNEYDIEQEFSGSAAVGLKSILGVQYSFKEISIYSQISFSNISYTTDKARILKSNYPNNDGLPAGMVLPFSSLSINIGLAVKL